MSDYILTIAYIRAGQTGPHEDILHGPQGSHVYIDSTCFESRFSNLMD